MHNIHKLLFGKDWPNQVGSKVPMPSGGTTHDEEPTACTPLWRIGCCCKILWFSLLHAPWSFSTSMPMDQAWHPNCHPTLGLIPKCSWNTSLWRPNASCKILALTPRYPVGTIHNAIFVKANSWSQPCCWQLWLAWWHVNLKCISSSIWRQSNSLVLVPDPHVWPN